MSERPSVALCLSGQMRMFEVCKGWIYDLRKHCEVDIFIHTWSDRGISTAVGRHIPRGMHLFVDVDSLDDRKLINLNVENAFREALLPDQKISHDLLAQHFDFMHAKIEDLPQNYHETKTLHGITCPREILDFSPRYYHNLAMFYKIWACDQLRQEEEERRGVPYDAVIRLRPDRKMSKFNFAALARQALVPDTVYTHYSTQSHSGLPYVSDQVAYGDSRSMKAYASVWERLSDYWDMAKYPDWAPHQRVIGLMLERHLRIEGVQPMDDKAMKGELATEGVSFEDGMRATHVFDKTRPALAQSLRTEMVHYSVRDTQTLDEARAHLAAIKSDPQDNFAAQAYIAMHEGNEEMALRAITALYRLPLSTELPTSSILPVLS